MRTEIQRWLDGEIEESELPAELRTEARRWTDLLDSRREPSAPAPPWIAHAVMARIAARTTPGMLARLACWFTQPQTVRVRPLSLAAVAAAALAAVLLWPAAPPIPAGPVPATPGTRAASLASGTENERVYVQFVYVAPRASSVAVAGDFNEWSGAGSELRDPDGDGVWTAYLPVHPGLHKYMFLVDGKWVTDPRAERHVDDGFGNSNALITVLPPGSAI